jgi:hypothetical protein
MQGQRLAEAASNILGNKLPSSGTTERAAAAGLTGTGTYFNPLALVPNAILGLANAPVVRDVLPAVFAGRRPARVEALGELMERNKVPLRYLGSEAGRQLSPSDQTPEDYAMTRMAQLSPTAGALAAPEQMQVSALPVPAPEAAQPQVIKIGDHELVYDPSTDTLIEPATGRRVKDPEDILKPAAMYRGGLMNLARKYR